MAPKRSSAIWRALASPTRRKMLDRLRDGPRTTGQLAKTFPKLSRFAVMQHLRVLVDARLVLVRREGRFRFNYLNAIPLVQIYERWVSTYAAPHAHAALALKRFVEGDQPMPEQQPRLVKIENQITLNAPLQKVFDALTIKLDEWWQFRRNPNSRIIFEPHVGGRMYEDWGSGKGILYGINSAYDPPNSFCSAGTTGWSASNFITWHRLEADGNKTILKKSMQLFGEVTDELVTMIEQGNRAIMEKQLRDYVEPGIGRNT